MMAETIACRSASDSVTGNDLGWSEKASLYL